MMFANGFDVLLILRVVMLRKMEYQNEYQKPIPKRRE
jgi:hypothetical protein